MYRVLLLTAAWVAASAAPLSGQEAPSLERLAWLQGCWEAVSPQRTVEEHWMAPRGGSMLGMSRTVRGGELAGHELVMLLTASGRLVYRAYPANQTTTDFPALLVSDTAAVFENPDHDFPQRIGYRPLGGDSLLAWTEGIMAGQTRRIEFRYVRTHCPGP